LRPAVPGARLSHRPGGGLRGPHAQEPVHAPGGSGSNSPAWCSTSTPTSAATTTTA
jgi:hypothetical protein